MKIREMTSMDYEQVVALCDSSDADSCIATENVYAFGLVLYRNPGLSFVAEINGRIVAAIQCGHDARRGFVHFVAVEKNHQGNGVGTSLVNKVTEKLSMIGVRRCHIFIQQDHNSRPFWENVGWVVSKDMTVASREIVV